MICGTLTKQLKVIHNLLFLKIPRKAFLTFRIDRFVCIVT